MKTKTISFFLILLAGSLVYPAGSSFAVTTPTASNDSYVVTENSFLDVPSPGVLVNDTASKTLSAGLVTDVKNGTLVLNANGGFLYLPNANFHGIDRFTYVANDGTLSSNIATVTITVNPINHTPVARNDFYAVNENSTLTVKGIGVLGNDTNPDTGVLNVALVSNVLNGHLTLNQNGSFTYTPNPNFHGTDSFAYVAKNGVVSSNNATVTILVNQLNLPSNDNPILKLISDIQTLFSKITGLESEITNLKEQNSALDARVHQLESDIQNIHQNQGTTSTGQNNTQGNNEDNHGENENGQNGEHGNKNQHHDNQND